MKLNQYQILKIEKTVQIDLNKMIVMIDVAGDNIFSLAEQISNIYCVDKEYKIIWQVHETRTIPPHYARKEI